MAIINKTGITNGGTIEAEHITRAIDALSGVGTDSVVATGSFTGSFTGQLVGSASFATTASFALNAGAGGGFPYTGSAVITGSLVVTGSIRGTGGITGSFTGSLNGIAQNANALSTSNSTDNSKGFITFTNTTVTGYNPLNVNSSLTYNPGTRDLTVSSGSFTVSGSSTSFLNKYLYDILIDGAFKTTPWYSGNIVYGVANSVPPDQQAAYLEFSTSDWQSIDQSTFDTDVYPLIGVVIERNANGTILLDGYLKAKTSGSSGTGPAIYGTIQEGYGVWVSDAAAGRLTTTIPGSGPCIRMGSIYAYDGSATIILRVDPKWVKNV